MDCNVDLSRTTLLGRFRDRKVQEERRSSSFFRSSFQKECLRETSNSGAPRYLVGKEETEKRRMREISFLGGLTCVKKEDLGFFQI